VVPSPGGTLFYVRTFSSELRRDLKLVFAELRGSRSDVGDVGSATLDTIADDLDRLSSELKLERIAVLGPFGSGVHRAQIRGEAPRSHLACNPLGLSTRVLKNSLCSHFGRWT
jgi:hypothetical protein